MLLSSVGRWVKQGGIAALLFGLVLVAPGCGDAPPGVPGPQIQETTGLWRTSLEGYGMTGRTTIDLSGSGTSGHKYVEAVGTIDPKAWIAGTTYWSVNSGGSFVASAGPASCDRHLPDGQGQSKTCTYSFSFQGQINCSYGYTVEASTSHEFWWISNAFAINSTDRQTCGPSQNAGSNGGTGWNCWSEFGYIEISYNGGATWSRIWEGYITYCEGTPPPPGGGGGGDPELRAAPSRRIVH
jgi:hypothetical protein